MYDITIRINQIPIITIVFMHLEQILREHIYIRVDCRCNRLTRDTVHNTVAIHYLVLHKVGELIREVSTAIIAIRIFEVVCAIKHEWLYGITLKVHLPLLATFRKHKAVSIMATTPSSA